MSLGEKRKWILLMYSTVLFLSLPYIKKVLLFYKIDFANVISLLIIHGGIVYFIIILAIFRHLEKEYATPSAVILKDKQVLIPFILAMILGIGIWIM